MTGAQLRDLRQHAGLTQREVAERAGLSVSIVKLVEHGYRPSSESLRAIRDVLVRN